MIIIPEGAADGPLEELGGLTPLEAAETVHLDRLSERGRLGVAVLTPEGLPCTDDVTLMSLLGYDPQRFGCGAGVLEAAGAGERIGDGRWALRVSLVTVAEGAMLDERAGGVSDAEGARLLEDLQDALAAELGGEGGRFRLLATGGHRGLLIDEAGRTLDGLVTHGPAVILGRPIRKHLPAGECSEVFREIVDLSARVLADHEVNAARRELGELPATHLWPWGAGRGLALPSFASQYEGLRGVMVCGEGVPAGMARMIGWETRRIEGSGYEERAGRQAVEALKEFDVVCVHASGADTAAHEGDVKGKVDALAAVDAEIVGPVVAGLQGEERWRVLIAPSHGTKTETRRHDAAPVPLMMAGELIEPVVTARYAERSVVESDLHIDVGSELMEYLLFGSGIGRMRNV